MNKALGRMVSLVFPNRCIGCGKVQKHFGFCAECEKQVIENPTGSCPKCGKTRGLCDCITTDLAFDGFCAPFLYKDSVRRSLLNMKFYNRPDIADHYAGYMAETVRQEYSGIRFDGVVAVPASAKGLKERGYNQSERLACGLSEILQVPVLPGVLIKVKDTAVQHDLGMRARFANVKGAYMAHTQVRGKCILLVDDIKTTGATLHECASMLKGQGAAGVFCVAAAMNR